MALKITRRSFIIQSGTLAAGCLFAANQCNTDKNQGAVLRFGLVTDSHYADREPSTTRFYQESMTKMRECIDLFNQEKLDFVVHLGDFKDQGKPAIPEETLEYLKAIESEYGRFKGPRYHCVGNHDVDSITKQQFLENIENTGVPNNESFYAFTKNGIQFIVLDANFYEDGRDHFYLEGANWQDTRIPPKQVQWLEKTLAGTDIPAIVFCHHPLYEFQRHDSIYHVQNYTEVQKVLEQSGKVMAVFQGHTHAESHELINGIHYLTLLAMVDQSGPENNAYAIAELYPSGKIDLIGYRREVSRTLGER